MCSSQPSPLLQLPSEILINIFLHLTAPSFLQTVITCRQLFQIAASSREIALHHLRLVPGIKLGLEDLNLDTAVLFRILRQRACANLYGANFNADCRDLRFRNGSLNPSASCLADSTDYINISLAMKESLVVRHFGSHCTLKEHTPPYARGLGRVLKIVHWKSTISILYESDAHQPPPCTSCTGSSHFHPPSLQENTEADSKDSEPHPNGKVYHLAHYNAYTNDRPDIFQIPFTALKLEKSRTRHIFPVHLAVHNRLKCAILWDDPSKSNSKRSHSTTLLYTADRLPPPLEEACYRASLMYPFQHTTKSDDSDPVEDRNEEYLSRFRPNGIAFAEGGRSLKMYRSGSITPYAVLSTKSTGRRELSPFVERSLTNEVRVSFSDFKIDSAFFGQHFFNASPGAENGPVECLHVYLHLATAEAGRYRLWPQDIAPADLYIVQSRATTDAEDCNHTIALDDHGSVHYNQLKVIARLWGWSEVLSTNSTMTGLDTVCVSPKGTRIAIACWDKILVWALHPEILCEDWIESNRRPCSPVLSSVDGSVQDNPAMVVTEGVNEGTTADDASDAGWSISEGQDNNKPNAPRGMVMATRFYDLVSHPQVGEIVELKPIVLKLPGGAIARKMMWNSSNKEVFDDSAEDSNELDWEYARIENDDNTDSTAPLSPINEAENPFSNGARGLNNDELICHGARLEQNDSDTKPPPTFVGKENIKSIGEGLEKLVNDTVELDSCIEWPVMADESDAERGRGREQGSEAPRWAPPHTATNLSDIAEEEEQETETAPPHDAEGPGTPAFPQPESSSPPHSTALPTNPHLQDPPHPTHAPAIPSSTDSISDGGSNSESGPSRPRAIVSRYESDREYVVERPCSRTRKRREHRKVKRDSEDELVVLTDRGVQLWDLGVWAKGRRERGWLDERLL